MTVRRVAPFAPFVLLAYLPALLSSPGRMPADSKLYLYLDPGGFFADAAASFDPGQFAGWVPHQHIGHLWPTLPWFWTFDVLGVPDWIAHRLWIGTLFVAAGLGVHRSARLLGLGRLGAVVAGVVYQTSPYVLPYVSRTSVMLLPWAGLGWIVAFTVIAARRRTWGDAAPIALVVLTVGAVNATALLMIVPAPLLWLAHEVARRAMPLRAAVGTAVRTGLLCIGVSLWWIAALLVQARFGAEVLPYSEALADVSASSTAPEVWRGLGYWLFYVRDPYAPTTSAAAPYVTSSAAIAISFAVPIVGLAGLTWVRWAHRRFAALLVGVGGLLAVGVHPTDDRSPLVELLSGGGDGGLVLALRSSTRAVPLLVLGLALAGGSLVDSVPRPDRRRVASIVVAGLALVNVPALWTASLVDPAIDRDAEPPDSWTAAADVLVDPAGRVLVVPGAEFGAYRWGYTVDQPLPGLTDKPIVTRDLLPLGSPAAMDLLFAFDDRLQDGVLEPASLAPVARLLGVDTVWLANDSAFDRFRIARPEIVRDLVLAAPGVDDPVPFGEPTTNDPDVPMVDEASVSDPRVGRASAPVELVDLTTPGRIDRVADRTVLVAGSGDGIVDAAAAGLLVPGVALRYTADGPEFDTAVVGVIVTDSNRDRARHWRGSQDTTGYTETGRPGAELLRAPIGDARLPLFPGSGVEHLTTARQVGSVTATATSYGEPFAYTPEHRPVMAIDGDPSTAWLVGEHGDPVGETLRLDIDHRGLGKEQGLTAIRVLQRASSRHVSAVEIEAIDASGRSSRQRVELDERSWLADGQLVQLGDVDPIRLDLTVAAVVGDRPDAVGFAEIDLGLQPTVEIVVPPTDAGVDALPLARVFTRLRTDPLDRWRSDPEPALVRAWTEARQRTFVPTFTARVDARSSDADLAELVGWPVVADRRLAGSLRSVGAAAFDGDPSTAWTSPFGDPTGSLTVDGVDSTIDEVRIQQPTDGRSTVVGIVLRSDGGERRVRVTPDRSGAAVVVVDPPLRAGELTIEVSDVVVRTTTDRRFGDAVVLPFSISEIDFEGAPEITPLTETSFSVECATVAHLDGRPLRATSRTDGPGWLDGGALATTPCDEQLDLGSGDHLLVGAAGTVRLDRVVLDDGLTAALVHPPANPGGLEITERGRYGGRYTATCPEGCWFVLGEGFSTGWRAAADGRSLGSPVLVDGGFNGWWIEPGTTEIVTNWAPRGAHLAASIASLGSIVTVVALAARRRRRSPSTAGPGGPSTTARPEFALERVACSAPGLLVVAAWAVPAALVAGPGWGLLAAAGGLAASRHRGVPLASLTALATVGTIGAGVVAGEVLRRPTHDLGWPGAFDVLHGVGMLAFALVVTSALVESDREPDVFSPAGVDGRSVAAGAAAR